MGQSYSRSLKYLVLSLFNKSHFEEILNYSPYGYSPDWWSLGILTYEMLCGVNRYPFDAHDQDNLFEKIKTREPRLQSRILSELSRVREDLK